MQRSKRSRPLYIHARFLYSQSGERVELKLSLTILVFYSPLYPMHKGDLVVKTNQDI